MTESPFTESEACTKSAGVPESSKVHESAKVPESGEKSAALTFSASCEVEKVKAPRSQAEIIAECDPNVRPIVQALMDAGFDTTDSGDGAKTDMDCALDFPHVAGVFGDEDDDSLSIMEQHADDIAEAASAQAGAPWDCEVSWSTADRQWTWFAHPKDALPGEAK